MKSYQCHLTILLLFVIVCLQFEDSWGFLSKCHVHGRNLLNGKLSRTSPLGQRSSQEASEDLGSMSIEEIIALANAEKKAQQMNDRQEKLENTEERKKLRKDKEYEDYWRRRERSPRGSKAAKLKEESIARAYYSVKPNESLRERISSTSSRVDIDESRKVSGLEVALTRKIFPYHLK